MSQLTTLLTDKAKEASASTGYSGELNGEAWGLLEIKYSWPYLIIEGELKTLRNKKNPHARIKFFSQLINNDQ